MRVMVLPIAVGALGTVSKSMTKRFEELEIRGGIDTIQTTALLRSVRILRKVLETWKEYLSLRLEWKTTSKRRYDRVTRNNNNNNNNNEKRLGKGTGRLRNQRTIGDYLDYNIIKNVTNIFLNIFGSSARSW